MIPLNSVILKKMALVLFSIINIVALYLLFRGHNHPGGGFIAGLISANSLVLLAISYPLEDLKDLIPFNPFNFVVLGFTGALSVAIAPLFFGKPLLQHSFFTFSIPIIGIIEISTALIFDFGIYLLVTGGAFKIIDLFRAILPINLKEDDQ